MAAKKTGISPELIIHPGETIADILEDRGITQADLASRTGVSPAYVCSVINGKKGISANFAMGLEYALGVPKSFWLNLQANYESELLEANEALTITEEERDAREALKDVVKYLRSKGKMPPRESKENSILSLRKVVHDLTPRDMPDLSWLNDERRVMAPWAAEWAAGHEESRRYIVVVVDERKFFPT